MEEGYKCLTLRFLTKKKKIIIILIKLQNI